MVLPINDYVNSKIQSATSSKFVQGFLLLSNFFYYSAGFNKVEVASIRKKQQERATNSEVFDVLNFNMLLKSTKTIVFLLYILASILTNASYENRKS